tara:strand:+ start:474 stop:668 length:195 start_codon:yes stop_codon:yes gene_type:complete
MRYNNRLSQLKKLDLNKANEILEDRPANQTKPNTEVLEKMMKDITIGSGMMRMNPKQILKKFRI